VWLRVEANLAFAGFEPATGWVNLDEAMGKLTIR